MQPVVMARQLVQPHGALVAEGNGQGLHAMGAARHGRVPMGPGQPRQLLAHGRHVAHDHGMHFLELQRDAGVDHVLGGGAVMQPLAVVAAAARLQLLERRHQGVFDAADLGRHLGDVDVVGLGLGADLAGRLGRDDAELGLGLGQGRLEIQPLLDAVLLGEDGAHFIGAPVVLERLHIENGNGHDAGSWMIRKAGGRDAATGGPG